MHNAERSLVPSDVVRAETFFIPPYRNDAWLGLEDRCHDLGIRVYRGPYGGAADLAGFRGIIHAPYSWSTFALFENMQLGLPYVIPSRRLVAGLVGRGYFWPDLARRGVLQRLGVQPSLVGRVEDLPVSEWYCRQHRSLFAEFETWTELGQAAQRADLEERSRRTRAFARSHASTMLDRWRWLLATLPVASRRTSAGRSLAPCP
jgi:hypothetical protein